MKLQLAEYNFGTLRHGWDDPRSAAFVAGLDLVNGIAETSPGFVWRLTNADPGHEGAQPGDLLVEDRKRMEGPGFASTLSIWESVADLVHFLGKTVHKQFYSRKTEWYDAIGNGNMVLWSVPVGHRPTETEGMARWRYHQTHGNTDHAFDWSHAKDMELATADGTVKRNVA